MVEFLVLLVVSLVPLLWFRGDELILGHDSGFRLHAGEHIANLSQTWHPNVNFGIDWSLYQGFIPIQLPESISSWLTGSLMWGERVSFIFWIFAIGLSMLLFVRYFFHRNAFFPMYVIAPVFWIFNFYLLNGWSIAERAKFSLYIVLPLIIIIFFKTIRREWSILKGGLICGFLFLFMNGGGSPPLYGAIIVTVSVMVMFFLVWERESVVRVITSVLVFAMFFVLFNAYFLLPQMRLLGGSYTGAVAQRGGMEGLIAWEREISKYASVPNILGFAGFPNWYDNPDHPYADAFLTNGWLRTIRFFPIAVVALGVLFWAKSTKKSDRQILLFLFGLGVVGLFFTQGSHPPFGTLYTYLMRHVPGFAIFRSSIYKFAPTVYLAIIVSFSYFISRIISVLTKDRRVAVSIGIAFAAGIVLFHYPFLTGNFFSIGKGFTTKVVLPSYVSSMAQYLDEQTAQTDRILLVPPLDTGYINSPIDTYRWGYYSLDVLPRISVNRSFLANDSDDDSITSLLYRRLSEGNDAEFSLLAKVAGITHVLWRADARLSVSDSQKALESWQSRLDSHSTLRMQYDAGVWKLYRFSDRPVPMVYAATDISAVSGPSPDDAYLVSQMSDSGAVILREDGLSDGLSRSVWTQAECFYCKTHEFTKLVEAITLPPVSTLLPFVGDRQMRAIVRVIEKEKGKPQELDARLSLASLVLARGQKEAYETEMNIVVSLLAGFSGRQRDLYASRVLAYAQAHARDREAVVPFVAQLTQHVSSLAWKAEGGTYRFGVTVPVDGKYRLWTPEPQWYDATFTIDGMKYPYETLLSLSGGYHRIEMSAKNQIISQDAVPPVFLEKRQDTELKLIPPTVTFTRVSLTRYDVQVKDAQTPFVLVFNQRFHPGWVIRNAEEYAHTTANGFANAWIISRRGTYALSLVYAPQKQVYIGSIVTAIMVVIGLAYLFASRPKRI